MALAAHLKHRAGDKAYMLDVICTLTLGTHYYFAKGFVAPKTQRAKHTVVLDN